MYLLVHPRQTAFHLPWGRCSLTRTTVTCWFWDTVIWPMITPHASHHISNYFSYFFFSKSMLLLKKSNAYLSWEAFVSLQLIRIGPLSIWFGSWGHECWFIDLKFYEALINLVPSCGIECVCAILCVLGDVTFHQHWVLWGPCGPKELVVSLNQCHVSASSSLPDSISLATVSLLND